MHRKKRTKEAGGKTNLAKARDAYYFRQYARERQEPHGKEVRRPHFIT